MNLIRIYILFIMNDLYNILKNYVKNVNSFNKNSLITFLNF